MTRAAWSKVEGLFHAALERAPGEREAFVQGACGGDDELQREVLSLLAEDEGAERALEEPAAAAVTEKLAVVAGTRLGPYEVEALVGAGGMGEVYRARDTRLGRDVAIKVLPEEAASEPGQLRRFEQEARAVAALNDPNILTIHDVGTEAGVAYVVTELLEGETLRDVMRRREATRGQRLSFALQIARGLAAAHRKGIVHRDLKPENVFVTVDGRVKILDFGLAKRAAASKAGGRASATDATSPGAVLGTAAYMSPEQVAARPVDARSDIFALGVVLYELASGRHPFRRATLAATLGAILHEVPPPLASVDPTIPRAIEELVGRCLEKRLEERFQDAHDLALALEAVLTDPSGNAPLTDVEERSPYPGLASFAETDGAVFFGREAEVSELWEKIRRRRLLAVIGPSGAGKTSLMHAGIVPARPEGWGAVVCAPGRAPMRALARALAPELATDPDALRRLPDFEEPAVAEELVARWRRAHAGALVVVDQLEELFTLNPEPVQAAFAKLLGLISSNGMVHVVLSLRDDFLLHTQAHEPLKPVLAELTALLPLSGDGLRRAVEEPARRHGYRFEDPALVGEIVSAVEGVRGGLPLLAFAVSRLWEKRDRDGKLLTRAAYDAIGGVTGALARHAEATLDRVGPEAQAVVREVFRNLVTAHGTRAAMDREELLSAFPERKRADAVLCHLVDARLLTSYEVPGHAGEPGHQRVEIAHESLLAAWPRLVRWQAQDDEGALLRDQLRQAAHAWQERGRTRDLLWTGTAYREFEMWRERYPGALTAVEEEFGRAMAERERRKRRLVLAAATAVFLATAGVAVAIGLSRQQATRARDEAQAQARRAEASKLVALGRAELDRYPTAAVAYGRKSLEVADTPEGRRFVVDALWRSPTARVLPLGNEIVWTADFSPDGHWLAAFGPSHLLLFGDDGGAPRIIRGQPPSTLWWSIGFTPDGKALLAQTPEEAPRVRMYAVPDGKEIRRFEPVPPGGYGAIPRPRPGRRHPMSWTPMAQGILFLWWPADPSPGAREPFGIWPYGGGPPTLVGSLRGSAAHAWVDAPRSRFLLSRGRRLSFRSITEGDRDTVEKPLVTTGEIEPKGWHGLEAAGVSYGLDPAGLNVWAADVKDGAGRLRVWSLPHGPSPEPRVFSMPIPDWYFGPAWDPTGSLVAWGFLAERAVWLWDLAGPPDAAPTVLRRPDADTTRQSLFSPQSTWLVVANHSTLTFWSLAGRRTRVLAGHTQKILRLRFTPDSRSLLSCGDDSVRLWPLGPGRGAARRIANDFLGRCLDAGLSPDGQHLALAGNYGAWLAPSIDGAGRWLWDCRVDTQYFFEAVAWDASARRLALASSVPPPGAPNALVLLDLVTGNRREVSLVPPGEPAQGFEWGVLDLVFTPEGRLLAGGSGGVRWIDAETGAFEWVWRLPKSKVARFALTSDGRDLVAASSDVGRGDRTSADWEVVSLHLGGAERRAIRSHGGGVTAVALDASGRTLVTGDELGVVRVGPVDGSEPHRLCCHAGKVSAVAVSPDGQWIASASGGEIRLWPMPDVGKPPLHMLPREMLLAKLDELTNIRVIPDATSATGYRLDFAPFPGWKDTPTW